MKDLVLSSNFSFEPKDQEHLQIVRKTREAITRGGDPTKLLPPSGLIGFKNVVQSQNILQGLVVQSTDVIPRPLLTDSPAILSFVESINMNDINNNTEFLLSRG